MTLYVTLNPKDRNGNKAIRRAVQACGGLMAQRGARAVLWAPHSLHYPLLQAGQLPSVHATDDAEFNSACKAWL